MNEGEVKASEAEFKRDELREEDDIATYEIQAKIDAGLQMCGKNADGEIEWIGTREQWRLADDIIDAHDTDPQDSNA